MTMSLSESTCLTSVEANRPSGSHAGSQTSVPFPGDNSPLDVPAPLRTPPEVYDRIFELIDPSHKRHGLVVPDSNTLLSAALVCRAWNGAALRRLYHTVRVPNDSVAWAAKVTNALRTIGPLVRTLIFEPAEWVWDDLAKTADVVHDCLPLTPNVITLAIQSPTNIDERKFEAVLGCMSKLKRLTWLEWDRTYFPAISNGEIDYDTVFTTEHVRRIRECLPNLAFLYLGPILHSTATSTPVPLFEHLASLTLEGLTIRDHDLLKILSNQTRLRYLDLGYADTLSQPGITAALLCVRETLVELRLAGTFKHRPPNTPPRSFQLVLTEFTALESLRTTVRAPAFNSRALALPPPNLRRWLAWDVMPHVGPDTLNRFLLSSPPSTGGGEKRKLEFVLTVPWELWKDKHSEAIGQLKETCFAKGLTLVIRKGAKASMTRPAEGEVEVREV